jgi:hypothetical protein
MSSTGSISPGICLLGPVYSEVGRHSIDGGSSVLTEPFDVTSAGSTKPPYGSMESMEFGIRLLELAPGSFEDTIRLRIIVTNLQDVGDLTYEALSYVWGVDIASSEVYIDDIRMEVTLNLDIALRHLRRRWTSRVLWIDALSINQQNVQERNKQVRNMGLIYQQATSVLIWLGQVDNNDVHLRAMLGAMQFSFSCEQPRTDLFEYICSVMALIDLNVAGSRNPRDRGSRNPRNRAFEALYALVSRPWFRRLWVVQELALSKSASIRIGTYSFPWAAFERFVRWLPNHELDFKKHRKLVEAAHQVMKLPSAAGFYSQLYRTLHLSTTDPRDKIFGILGISTFDTSRIEPDYGKSSGRIYTETVALLLSQTHTSIYWHVPLRSPKGSYFLDTLPDLPSWVPDFRISEFRSQPADEAVQRCHLVSFLVEENSMLRSHAASLRQHPCMAEYRRPRILPVTSLDFATLFTTGSAAKKIIWTSGALLADLDTTSTTSGVQKLVQRLYLDATRVESISTMDFISALLGSIRGNDSWLIPEDYLEAATELVKPTYQGRDTSFQLRRRIHEVATAIRTNNVTH